MSSLPEVPPSRDVEMLGILFFSPFFSSLPPSGIKVVRIAGS